MIIIIIIITQIKSKSYASWPFYRSIDHSMKCYIIFMCRLIFFFSRTNGRRESAWRNIRMIPRYGTVGAVYTRLRESKVVAKIFSLPLSVSGHTEVRRRSLQVYWNWKYSYSVFVAQRLALLRRYSNWKHVTN